MRTSSAVIDGAGVGGLWTSLLLRCLLLLLLGGLAAAVSTVGSHAILTANGYSPAAASVPALVLAQIALLALLPLLAGAFLERRGGGLPELVGAWAGSSLSVGGGAVWYGASVAEALAGQAMVLAVALLLLAVAQAPCFFALPTAGRRSRILGGQVLLLSSPFWVYSVLALIEDSALREAAKTLAIWLAPAACLSSAWSGFEYAALPQTYSIWLGPLVAYPEPLTFMLIYGALAGGIAGGTWFLRRRQRQGVGSWVLGPRA